MSKSKNNYVLIGILIVIIPIMLCVGAYIVFSLINKPEKKWNEYTAFLKESKYEEMYDLLDSTSQAKITKEDFITRNKNIYEGIGAKNIDIQTKKVEKQGMSCTITYDTNMDTTAGNVSFSNKVELDRELKDGFKVSWSSNLIFPELNDDDKVRVKTLKSKRGNILDRNGELLATDSYVSSVGIVPGKLGGDRNNTISKIASILNMSVDSINKSLSASYVQDDMFVPIKDIESGSDAVNELTNIPCIMIQDKDSRVYPLGEITAHLTGYVQTITQDELNEKTEEDQYTTTSLIGKAGLEKMFEDKLRGIDGVKIYIIDNAGTTKSEILTKNVRNGQDVQLTIDLNLQKLLYEQLKDDKGTSVAMNPGNGELLALVSTPSYNPNHFVLGMSQDEWDSLNNSENKPLYNRFQATFAPGSSFKPFTAAIGLDNNKIDPNQNKNIQGLSWQKDSSWGNYNVTRVHSYTGESNLKNALIYSDNIYFAQAALDIGADLFKEKLEGFGVGEQIPCDFALYNSQITADVGFKNEIQLADSGYGQGDVLMNPVQLASMYTMFQNDGNILKPKLLLNDTSSNSIWKNNVISKATSDAILEDLYGVVEVSGGTGNGAAINNLKIAAKTGTAEIKKTQDDTEGTELGWFSAMTTNKQPNNMLVVMMVEDVKNRGGSSYVVPKVRAALETVK